MEIKENQPLYEYSRLNVGGIAEYLATATNKNELLDLLSYANRRQIFHRVIGGGTNIAFSSNGLSGLTIRCKFDKQPSVEPTVPCGENLSRYIHAMNQLGYDASFLAGIPGTIGGAVANNSGTQYGQIEDVLQKATVFSLNDGMQIVDKSFFNFKYRHSIMKYSDEWTLVDVTFDFPAGDIVEIRKRIASILQERVAKHPMGNTLGSTFKNPTGYKAWELIDDVNLRGLKIGNLQISEQHPNWIVNPTGEIAYSDDLNKLLETVISTVRNRSGIILEPEIQIMSEN